MFYSRENELGIMNGLFSIDEFRTLFLYGRGNIGKSSLIREFAKDKDSLYFSAYDSTEKFNLEVFSKKTYKFFGFPETTGSFQSWDDAFNFIAGNSKKYKFVIVIDNSTKLVNEKSEFQEVLASYINNHFIDNKFMLILSGRHDEFSDSIISAKSPLWGKQDKIIKLEELDFFDSSLILGDMGFEDKIIIYNCIGGVPGYLSQIDHNKTAIKNIRELFFNKTGYLFLETKLNIKEHINKTAVYNSILYSIAKGNTRSGVIAEDTGINRNKLSKYLNNLIENSIISKETPYGDNPINGRKGRYSINCRCIKFWYRFIFPVVMEIESHISNEIYDDAKLEELIKEYSGNTLFKEICLQHLINENKKFNLPFLATGIKFWWGEKREFIIAYNHMEKSMLINCFLLDENIDDAKEISYCMRIADTLSRGNKVWYHFLSNRQFSEAAHKIKNENKNISLLCL